MSISTETTTIPCSKFKFVERNTLLKLRLFEDLLPEYVQDRLEEALVE